MKNFAISLFFFLGMSALSAQEDMVMRYPAMSPSDVCISAFYSKKLNIVHTYETFYFRINEKALTPSGSISDEAIEKVVENLGKGAKRYFPEKGFDYDFDCFVVKNTAARTVYVSKFDVVKIRVQFIPMGERGQFQADLCFYAEDKKANNGW